MPRLNKDIIKRYFRHMWVWMLRYDVFIFLVFVAIATLFWWGRAMSSPREVTISLPITYTDVAPQIVFDHALPTHIDVTMRDNGKLLRQINHTSPTISINIADRLNTESGTLTLTAEALRPKIQDVLPGSTSIQHIKPEIIESAYYRQDSKIVPISLQAKWQLANQYQLANPPIIEPSYVEIFGTPQVIYAVDSILTDYLFLDNLNDTIQQEIPLILPDNIRTTINAVQVTFIAEQFTDKSFVIPIHIENIPNGETLRLFPQEVTITVRVGISHFTQVNPSEFRAICQYPTQSSATLPIQIIHNNPYVTQMRTNIREIEYIIER